MSFFGTRRQIEATTEAEQSPALRPALPAQTSPIGFETVIGANCQIEGKFKSNSNVRIDGALSGTLEVAGNMLVGETAKIEADVHARNISIAGAVRGNVYGKKVQILRTGRVWGDIHATALTTEEGAFIDGKITMLGHSATHPSAPVTTPDLTVAETDAPAEVVPPNPPDESVSQE